LGGGVLPPVPLRPPGQMGHPTRHRCLGRGLRLDPRAGVRGGRPVGGPGCRPPPLLATMGFWNLDRSRRDPRGGQPVGGDAVKRIVVIVVGLALLATAAVVSVKLTRSGPLRVGAIYPLSGSQGPGGVEEYR